MEVQYKKVETIPEFIESIRLRVDVFIKEQGFEPGWEPDADDKNAVHYVAILDDQVVSTVRFRELSPGEYKIERLATRKERRGKGISKKLFSFVLKDLKKQKPKKIWLRSQHQIKDYYYQFDFEEITEPFEIFGKLHIDMQYKNL